MQTCKQASEKTLFSSNNLWAASYNETNVFLLGALGHWDACSPVYGKFNLSDRVVFFLVRWDVRKTHAIDAPKCYAKVGDLKYLRFESGRPHRDGLCSSVHHQLFLTSPMQIFIRNCIEADAAGVLLSLACGCTHEMRFSLSLPHVRWLPFCLLLCASPMMKNVLLIESMWLMKFICTLMPPKSSNADPQDVFPKRVRFRDVDKSPARGSALRKL